eukprot:TRINITY_DN67773_c0_g1_i1.p1 TRINITY_DN67773_c0_g1~~TRINITY_DN67773_c0_g1_i1.p1  ORF type:complete len:327 (+),score=43.89 TRINITY_DN67773_c0_g1_i1:71-1051(+)
MPNIETITATGAYPVNLHLPGAPAPKEEVFISPLEVSFSQNVIYPLFSDGKSVDDAMKAIRVIGEGKDAFLEPPFPDIEAVRWCPKLRDGEGKPILDSNGEERRGVEGLFTLDNRRLYALQRAAVSQYPRKCRIKVYVITERFEVLRHLKKFRTRTNGLSVTVSEWNGVGRDNAKDFNAMRVWDWRSAVAKIAEGSSDSKASSAVEVADAGSCGCWQYLDPKENSRGPFSNFQMRQWWEKKMLPPDLKIRPYFPGKKSDEKFRPVVEVFENAPAPFAPGYSPRASTTETEGEFHMCAECGRQRLEGWSARGNWYCVTCWKKWEVSK